MKDFLELKKDLKKKLDKKRYIHSVGVAYTAASLAMRYDYDINKALIAGIMHDCAKQYNSDKLVDYCKEHKIQLSEIEFKNKSLIHAKAGCYMAQNEYEINDPDILEAIRFHTTGRKNMTLLEKIIYISDYIEPSREGILNLDMIRKTAFSSIDEAVYLEAKSTIDHLNKKDCIIDDATLETLEYYYNYYQKLSEEID